MEIPKSFRLSTWTRKNIVKSARIQKFKKEVIDLAFEEADLVMCCQEKLYPLERRNAVVDDICRHTGYHRDVLYVFSLETILVVRVSRSEAVKLGGTHYNDGSDCIVCSRIFADVVNNSSYEETGIIEKDDNYSRVYLWKGENIVAYEPITIYRMMPEMELSLLGDDLIAKVKIHNERANVLLSKVEKFTGIIKNILNNYTSAKKLCNDAPEFIEYINDSLAYNKDGHKCTDVEVFDSINELRKQ